MENGVVTKTGNCGKIKKNYVDIEGGMERY